MTRVGILHLQMISWVLLSMNPHITRATIPKPQVINVCETIIPCYHIGLSCPNYYFKDITCPSGAPIWKLRY